MAGAAVPPRAEAAPDAQDEVLLVDLVEMVRESPPWLFSAIVHMLAMIIFGLLVINIEKEDDLLLDVGYSDDLGDPLADDLHLANTDFEVDDDIGTVRIHVEDGTLEHVPEPTTDADVVVRADLGTLARLGSGGAAAREALASGAVELEGPAAKRKAYTELFRPAR